MQILILDLTHVLRRTFLYDKIVLFSLTVRYGFIFLLIAKKRYGDTLKDDFVLCIHNMLSKTITAPYMHGYSIVHLHEYLKETSFSTRYLYKKKKKKKKKKKTSQ